VIARILVVGQGPNDMGFLEGLRDRLGCDAELIDYSANPHLRKRGSYTKTNDARLIWERRENADLIVRLTDGDVDRPQEVRRK